VRDGSRWGKAGRCSDDWVGWAGSQEKIQMEIDSQNSYEFEFWQDFENFYKEI
jgi:hypothetical protein